MMRTVAYRVVAFVLLSCLVQAVSVVALGQDMPRAAMKRAHAVRTDTVSLHLDSLSGQNPLASDSVIRQELSVADSIDRENRQKLQRLSSASVSQVDSLVADSMADMKDTKRWIPNPTTATWLALVIPGGGQIYNRKYWKLPIFYGGFAGCAYALTWNGKMYRDYSNAYRDAVNENWTSSSITDLLPPGYMDRVSKSQLTETLRRRKDSFRRFRDLSIFAFIGVYLLSVVDAYVDAELSNFDITPDLSMRVEPAVIDSQPSTSATGVNLLNKKSVGVQCSFRF